MSGQIDFSIPTTAHFPLCNIFSGSPVLAVLSGSSGVFMITTSLLPGMLGGCAESVLYDLVLSLFLLMTYTGPYVIRGFRLLVMYYPAMRVRFGTLVKESLMVRITLVAVTVLETMMWCAAWVFGVERQVLCSAHFTKVRNLIYFPLELLLGRVVRRCRITSPPCLYMGGALRSR